MPRLAVLALSIATTLSGCGSDAALRLAAVDTGKAEAGVALPELPDDCRRQEAHAQLAPGTEARTVLRRERQALDRQNARGGRCAGFYDEVKDGLEKAP